MYLAVFDRFEADEPGPAIAASLFPDTVVPASRFPDAEPVDRHPQDLHSGDLVAGVWDYGGGGRRLWQHFAGPVAAIGEIEHRRARGDWVTVLLTDGAAKEFKPHLWLAVHCCPPPQP